VFLYILGAIIILLLLGIGLSTLINLQNFIERNEKEMAETREQLDAILTQVTTLTTQLATDVAALLTAINNGQDFQAEADQVQASLTALQNIDTSVTTETGQLGGTPPPAPPAP
jgi:hypothetical protein